MYTLTQVKDELYKRYNQDIDLSILEECVHIWDIDYDENKQNKPDIYDEGSIRKLYRGIKLKNNGYNEKIISEILSKTTYSGSENEQSTTINTEEKEKKKELVLRKIQSKLTGQTNPSKAEVSNVIEIGTKERIEPAKTETTEAKEQAQESKPATDKVIDKMSDKVAKKVCLEILDFLRNDEFLNKLDNIGELKRDNEILSKQVKELIKVNEMLEDKVFQMELENRSFKKIWKNFYIKIFNS